MMMIVIVMIVMMTIMMIMMIVIIMIIIINMMMMMIRRCDCVLITTLILICRRVCWCSIWKVVTLCIYQGKCNHSTNRVLSKKWSVLGKAHMCSTLSAVSLRLLWNSASVGLVEHWSLSLVLVLIISLSVVVVVVVITPHPGLCRVLYFFSTKRGIINWA